MNKYGLLLAAFSVIASPSFAAAPRAVTATGVVEGTLEASGVTSYKGIPFAAPPVGDLRWKAPQPAQKWQGVRKADHFGPRAMQLPLFDDMVFRSDGVSEDCLYLNVWTPAKSARDKLPVLVYFYGGGFAAGDGSEPRYDGASMAAKGIVTLTVNYRLNIFGFLAHPELTAESPHKASGNYGLMDQAAALQWVAKNIAAFGGDPARVTIAGESAGSWSVSAQMISPLAKGLIAGAIGESGSLLGLDAPLPPAVAEKKGADFAEKIGAPKLAALRAMPAQQLLETLKRPDAPWFSDIQDGYVLPRSPVEMYAAGQQAKVPLLAGWNSQEGYYKQIFGDNEPTQENFNKALQAMYGERADAARQAYSGDAMQAATDLAGDRFIAHGTWKWVTTHVRTSGQPVYRYYYSHPRPGQTGAGHSVEIEYALGNLKATKVYAWTADDHALSAQMQDYFANFIKTGNPNGAGLPEWPRASSGKGSRLMRLDLPAAAMSATDDAHHAFQDQQRLSK
ncbi:carboxylesterase/lipase family protein [Duganella violaceipulchra]|uniref:Carboxylic ester hydrolase n=1 Tax=Duganella violaceipulchra TaxID=2849652 RepID=A0AA41L5U6_9BURK|nr:carboxylesterase family protein [Duganella violaceicalia]MBV6324594.1 carboxylesterase family protein [Duganella violaceicalia]MCP2009302.1 para-nitrobenzyl esterase [Duganella violaceicalia]